MGKNKKIVQWKIKNLRDEKISKKYSEDINDVIIEESQNIKERWQNLKGNYNGCNGNSKKQHQYSEKGMDYNGNSQHDRGKKEIKEFKKYR